MDYAKVLLGRDLRSISKSNEVANAIHDQSEFDSLFGLLWHHERILVMRVADAIEKVTRIHGEFLMPHKGQLLSLLKGTLNKELKWHVAQLLPRLTLDEDEAREVWSTLMYWVQNPNESKIVRVNSLQGLYDFSKLHPSLKEPFEQLVHRLETELIPSLQARIKKLKKQDRHNG